MRNFEEGIFKSGAPFIMGVINCTPDSFYSGGRDPGVSGALRTARRMIDEGADILDIGGESTRPGSAYIDAEEEKKRIIPVIGGIREMSGIPVSVDTRKAEVAAAALDTGADIINDISALEDDAAMAPLAAERNVPVILMHKKGNPLTMQQRPFYDDPVREITEYLQGRAATAVSSGIDAKRIVLDPGIGFGKRLEDNLALIRSIQTLSALGYPVLIGASRKSFIGTLLGGPGAPLPPEERLVGTVSVHMWAFWKGASIIRVHDVRPHAEMRTIFNALRGGGEE
jgi:dihydropteroate synthase